jgi:hypothetical protein
MQISADFIHVACDWWPRGYNLHGTGGHSGTIYMLLAATRVQFACDWRPLGYNLHGTGGHLGTIYMRLAASRMQTLHAKPPVFASTLREQLFELKNEEAIKNLRIYATHVLAKAYSLTLCMARSNLVRQFL